MLVRQQLSDAKLFGSNRRRKLKKLPATPRSSPLLLISKPEATRDWPCSVDDGALRGNDCSQAPCPMQINELCESPKASRYSMFRFSPSTSPELSPQLEENKNFSLHLEDLSSDSQLRNLAQDNDQEKDNAQDLSDDSPLSSPDSTPLVSSNDSPVTIDRKRYHIISEIISTESKYIENLNVILNVFMPALEHVVAPRALRLLIPAQLEMLVESHQEILSCLNERMSSETKFYGFVGDIFSRLCGHSNAEFFNMYRVYMGEFKLAMKTLAQQTKESTQFKEILSLLQQSPLCERLNMASYLLTPIQRLPRYELLLKELMKHTPSDHPDHYYIGEAMNRLRKELMKLNLSIVSCQMACPVVPKKTKGTVRRNGRKPGRTMSMLKKFMSTANIDDYSSGDNSFTIDDVKPPSLRMARRNSSICGSDADLSSSLTCEASMFRRQTLKSNRAVSCSDLRLEFDLQQQHRDPMKFRLLTPLASEPCTPNSSRRSSVDSQRHSFLIYSSDESSLSSDEGRRDHDTMRDGSLTPTEIASKDATLKVQNSVPSKDATLKVSDSIKFLKEEEEEEEEEEGVVADESTDTDAKQSQKNTWRLSLFKKRKNSNSKSELKYIKH